MNFKKILIISITLISLFFLLFLTYKKITKTDKKAFYKTEKASYRNIYQEINSTGNLNIKDNIKVGSLVTGTVKEIYVSENEKVKKGQLLAQIDNGKDDTDVKKAEADLERIIAELEYQEKYYSRQEKLFKSNQISKDFFEQVTRDLKKLKADKKQKEAELKQKQIEYSNTKILAPGNGVIVSVGISQGMGITTNLDATVLFEIADNINKMEAELDIDESDIGQVQKNQKIIFKVGTYLDKSFKGIINDISYSPKTKNNILSYKAYVDVDNTEQLLRPGMSINAKIKIAKCLNCLSIPSQAFQINSKSINNLAQKLNYQIKKIDDKEKKHLEKNNSQNYPIKFIWIEEDKTFEEKAVKINISDSNFFEIKTGITDKDNIVIDIEEQNEMESFYKKMFSGVL